MKTMKRRRCRLSTALFVSIYIVGTVCLSHTLFAASKDIVDTDGDILPDTFETQYATILDLNDPTDADDDDDNDRLTNRDEFFIGTNPTTYTDVDSLTEQQLLDLYKGKARGLFPRVFKGPPNSGGKRVSHIPERGGA